MQIVRETISRILGDNGISIAELAEAVHYHRGTINAYLQDRYSSSPRRIEQRLVEWARKQGNPIEGTVAEESFVDTRASLATIAACEQAQEDGEITAIIGEPGTGKTEGVRQYLARARAEHVLAYLVTANATCTSPVAIVRALAEQLGIRGSAPSAQLSQRCIQKLAADPCVVIIDEAQHLTIRALEALRGIHDAAGCGLVLVGSLQLGRTLEIGDVVGQELAQLQDRIALVRRVSRLTTIEVTRFVGAALGRVDDPDALKALRELSGQVPRRLVRLLNHCRRLRGEGKVTAALVREASKRLIGSQEEDA